MAWFYNEVWGEELSKLALHLVEELLLAHLCKGAGTSLQGRSHGVRVPPLSAIATRLQALHN